MTIQFSVCQSRRAIARAAVIGAAVAAMALTPVAARAADPGFYGTLRVGTSILENMNLADAATANLGINPDTGYAVDGALGYRFTDAIRVELNLGYSGNDLKGAFQENVQVFVPCGEFANSPCLDPNVNGDIGAVSGFAMAYYDFANVGRFKPYVGVGLGFVDVDLDVGTRATLNSGSVSRFAIINGSDTVVGYCGTVGVTYELGAADVSLGYTYTFTDRMSIPGRGTFVTFDFDRRANAHTLAAGVTYRF